MMLETLGMCWGYIGLIVGFERDPMGPGWVSPLMYGMIDFRGGVSVGITLS